MDKSVLLQKQVKDNSEDLQKEFLDMKNWEEQMKRKDQELRDETSGQITVPPVRSKTKKSKVNSATTKVNEGNQSKRIKSYDYSAWDQFDVDKACEDVDKQLQSDDSEGEFPSQEELEKAHEAATKHKNEGNFFVQQRKWVEAIACYNRAIEIFPHDAVFYANRALCQLKLDNHHAAEADCSAAIQLDETYVKAYHRRATARMNLKQYVEAKQDLEKILKLESSNKEAKSLLTKIEDKIEIVDSSNILNENTNEAREKTSIEKKIGEKLWSSTPKVQTADIKDTEGTRSNAEDEKHIKNVENLKYSKDITKEKEVKDSCIPDWLPERNDVAVIEPIERPPHLRSKKSLTKIPVEEAEFAAIQYNHSEEEIMRDKSELTEPKKPDRDDDIKKKNCIKDSESFNTNDGSTKSTDCVNISESPASIINLPPVPKTAVQFVTQWKTNTSTEFRYMYIKQLPENSLHKIFQDSMESDIFSGILEVLKAEFMKRNEPVYCYLKDLSKVKRFRALIMFISNDEKENLKVLFEHCKTLKNVSQEEITALQVIYEL